MKSTKIQHKVLSPPHAKWMGMGKVEEAKVCGATNFLLLNWSILRKSFVPSEYFLLFLFGSRHKRRGWKRTGKERRARVGKIIGYGEVSCAYFLSLLQRISMAWKYGKFGCGLCWTIARFLASLSLPRSLTLIFTFELPPHRTHKFLYLRGWLCAPVYWHLSLVACFCFHH